MSASDDTSAPDAIRTVAATAQDGGTRLDRLLAAALAPTTRTRLKALIEAGAVDRRAAGDGGHEAATIRDPAYRVKPGDVFRVRIPPPVATRPAAQAMKLAILYEDDDVIVVDKPAGLVVHPAKPQQALERGIAWNRKHAVVHCDLHSQQHCSGKKRTASLLAKGRRNASCVFG